MSLTAMFFLTSFWLRMQVPKVKEAYSLYLDDISVSYDNGWACVSGRKKGIVETSARPSQSLESQT